MPESTKLVYKELRDTHGKGILLTWQKMCNLFGFDSDPTVTVAFEVTPVVEDPSLMKPEEVGGPAGGPTRPPFDPDVRDELGLIPEHVVLGLDVDGDGKVDQIVTIERPTTKPEGAQPKEAE